MSQKGRKGVKAVVPVGGRKSGEVARRGVRTIEEFNELMLALMADVVEGSVTPAVVNAAANAGGKVLKAVELQRRYGQQPSAKALLLGAARKAA